MYQTPATAPTLTSLPRMSSKQTSSPPPGPTGSAAREPWTTSYREAFSAAFQKRVNLSGWNMTPETSPGEVTGEPLQVEAHVVTVIESMNCPVPATLLSVATRQAAPGSAPSPPPAGSP